MSYSTSLLDQLENREKVQLTPSHYLRKWNIVFMIISISVLFVDLFILFSFGKTYLTIGLLLVVTFLPVVFVYYLRKHVKSAYLKGDALIFQSFDKSSKVTSLRSVRKVSSTSFLGLEWIRLDYHLDGLHNSVLIVCSNFSKSNSPKKILNEAIVWSKKRKANHKPGSVAV